MANTDPEYITLSHRIYRDLTLDTLGNCALAIGLYLTFGKHHCFICDFFSNPISLDYVKAILLATGIVNLRFLPERLKRLHRWQQYHHQDD